MKWSEQMQSTIKPPENIWRNENMKKLIQNKWKTLRGSLKKKTAVFKACTEKFTFELRKLLSFKEWKSLKSGKKYFMPSAKLSSLFMYIFCLKLSW